MNDHLGAALVQAREQQGLEQQELAELLGIKRCMLSKVENGNRAISATEFLTLGLLFPNWFEMEIGDLATDLKADLAARMRAFLAKRSFQPLQFKKRDWLTQRLAELDGDMPADA